MHEALTPPAPLPAARLLEAARGGDEAAFRHLIDPFHGELHRHCYRMLGSVQDAEDALQETLLRAWRGLPAFEGRSSLRSWLHRIATNACLRLIERRPRRTLPMEHGTPNPDGDPSAHDTERLWIEPYPGPEADYEQRESVELAFIVALQHLPARQRAVLLLSDVLGFSPAEVAEALDATPTSVYSALQRARGATGERLPDRSQQATLRALGDERVRAVVERYVRAWDRGDAGAIVALLSEEAVFAMPPRPGWYRGRAAIRAFVERYPLAHARSWRMVPARVNGQLAFEVGRDGAPHGVHVLTLDPDARIREVTAFLR